jgi:hypothetical protein
MNFSPGDRVCSSKIPAPDSWLGTVIRYEDWCEKRKIGFPQYDKAYYDEHFDLVNDIPIKLDKIYGIERFNCLYYWGRKKGWHIIESCVHKPVLLLTSTICDLCGKTLK